MYRSIHACRICGNPNLASVLDLGVQTLTGIFPRSRDKTVTSGPLRLVKCSGSGCCGLLQLAHSYSLEEMYGENYGYRSGLNPSMVAHLKAKVDRIKSYGIIESGDLIVDIAANDGTTLKQYGRPDCTLVGIDPTATKFKKFYPPGIEIIAEFFGAERFRREYGARKAKVVTSFAMFYDLEDPISFMREICEILADEGIWVFEQSYMPSMLATSSYDTVCHEHLEYYSLAQIEWMTERVGLKIVDVELNDVNGGSFSVVVQKKQGTMQQFGSVAKVRESERRARLDDRKTYEEFSASVRRSRDELVAFLEEARAAGRKVVGLGASTKGNVLLQYCGVGTSLIPAIGEINDDKFGAFTPGSLIPIIDERLAIAEGADHFLVLPWHFRKFFDGHARYAGLHLVYPLPTLSFR